MVAFWRNYANWADRNSIFIGTLHSLSKARYILKATPQFFPSPPSPAVFVFSCHQSTSMKQNRRNFIVTAATLGAATAASAMPIAATKAKAPLAHHVFFWLKNPDSIEDRDKLVEGVKTLRNIETIREIHVGVLAATEKRDVVDTSWHVSELMFFTDLAGQATYQTHPIHLDFIKNYSHLWAKVIVYDAMEV